MPKTILNKNEAFLSMLAEAIAMGREAGMSEGEMATRAGITPETLSRMKKRGYGDWTIIDALARIVGKRMSLVPDDSTLESLRRGEFF